MAQTVRRVLVALLWSGGLACGCAESRADKPSFVDDHLPPTGPDAIASDARTGAADGGQLMPVADGGRVAPVVDGGQTEARPDAGAADACKPAPVYPWLRWSKSAAWTRTKYEGDAIVERSAPDELVLYVPADVDATDDAGVAEAHAGARYIVQSSNTSRSLPLLSPGTQLWLHAEDTSPNQPLYFPRAALRRALRVKAGGRLILGSLYDEVSAMSNATEPLVLNDPRALCTGPIQPACGLSAEALLRTYYSLAVQADSPVRARAGEQVSITLNATDYTLSISSAQSASLDKATRTCEASVSPGIWAAADVVIDDVSGLQPELTRRGDLPACVLGNAASPTNHVGYNLNGRTSDESVDEAATYAGVEGHEHVFTLASHDDFRVSAFEQFEAPTVGQRLWVTGNSQAFVLRTALQGEMLLAAASLNSQDSSVATWFSNALGMNVSLVSNCVYETYADSGGAHNEVSLFDVRFATEPALRIKTGSRDALTLGSKRFDAYPYGVGSSVFVLLVPSAL
jgi:hypothetical protein